MKKISRWHIVFLISIGLTILMVALWIIIPGFPLFIFLFFPPIFFWGYRGNQDHQTQKPKTYPQFCPQCGKQLIEPKEPYCPRCGHPLTTNISNS